MTRPILALLLASLFLVLSARAQTHFIGTGEAMEPTLIRGNRITVWVAALITLRQGDVVARVTPTDIIATRCRVYEAGRGWVTRADSVGHDDPGYLTSESLLGRVYLDVAPDGIQPRISSEETRDEYVLNPVYPLSYEGNPQGALSGPPNPPSTYWPPIVEEPPVVNDPPIIIDPLPPTGPHSVPEGGVPISLIVTVLGIIVMSRRFRA